MKRLLILGVACGLAVGCGPPAAPTLDSAGERSYEQQQKDANAAEGRKPKVPNPEN